MEQLTDTIRGVDEVRSVYRCIAWGPSGCISKRPLALTCISGIGHASVLDRGRVQLQSKRASAPLASCSSFFTKTLVGDGLLGGVAFTVLDSPPPHAPREAHMCYL